MDRSEWVRVPRVPSEEMVDCALRLLPNLPRVCMTVALEDAIAAAPPPPAEQASGEVAELPRYFNEAGGFEYYRAEDVDALSQRPVESQ